ncbi:chromosome segregation protein SMC [Verrucomicrobiaceae bacterium 5K15]|uniref:Chromosome partition protein Smc n=1 Tax=Oceaniferula flava TaxID=2800421 RepID=A0AAE2VEK9_9BACT|nr:chromosome segregation protein SMC [Oceaniferula flavus]MBK1855959.1 chromosome segregation protein SMC [Oceaniferula flavus]MBM1137266.1 chromosome segregation protein SMC [Oceaniferula flavus]
MYLKSLELHGFKSFADKTKFEFHPNGVTGIVGPNGCGKSNVVDAIRWVLGETSAKALRGGEMADVIFNGTDKSGTSRARAALGMAEVTMTLADCEETLSVDYNEVAITRRVFRDGKSEYRINGTLCRLRDIHELFMDTGIGRTSYSIMEQGKIDMLLSSKPEDRRTVFEEAAGITKFKKEKKEALRKLEYTEANLLRVSDVLAEQERRMNSLKRQVAKARRYQELAKDVRILDTHLAHRKFTEYTAELSELENSIHSLEVRETELEVGLPQKESAVIEARDAAQSLESELSEIRQQLNHHTNSASAAESRIAFNKERQSELEARVSQNQSDILEAQNKLEQQQFDYAEAEKTLEELSHRIESQQTQLAEHESRAAVQRAEREEKEAVLRSLRNEANSTQSVIAASQAKIESALSQMENSRERSRKLSEEHDRLQAEHEQAVMEQEKISAELNGRRDKLATFEEEKDTTERAFQHSRGGLDAAREAASVAHKELAKTSSRLDVIKQLVDSGEGFQKGTQAVLKGLDEPEFFNNGVKGVLAGLIEVQPEYAVAVEAALGSHLQSVLVTDSNYAQAIIDRLTEKKLGEAAIIPADFVAPTASGQMMTVPDGAETWAMDRVKADAKIASVIENLLGKVLIVSDLTTALEMRKSLPDVTLVTMRGDVCSPEGTVKGGISTGKQNSVLERQNEVRSLELEVAELEKAEEQARNHLVTLENQVSEQREAAEAARDRLQQARVEESTLQGQLTLANREVESLESKISSVAWERNDIKEREDNAFSGREALEADLSAARARQEQLEADQVKLAGELEEASRRENEAVSQLQEFRTSLAVERQALEAAEQQRSPMAARLEELRQISTRRDEEIASFKERMETALKENAELSETIEMHRAEARDLEQLLEETSASRGGLHQAIESSEKELSELRRECSKITEQKGREEVAATKIGLRLENLNEMVMERHQLELKHFRPDAHALLSCLQERAKQYDRQQQRRADNEQDASETSTSDEVADLPGDSGPDWSLVETIVTDLKRKVDSMGPVNVDAIEEYDELEDLHNNLRNQHDDLVNSKTELVEVIERINIETKKRFTATFNQVAANFKEMFKVLFGDKAIANLVLVDEDDPLESGIDIIAKPPGKKLQSITLLSGGERSMTAVALLFSIYQIKPSPFCVLDELDAPLDEANINRFLKVLDKFINNSQFIIVTHSKRTMARADVIYGVTMEDFGVSKPVGMRLTDSETANKTEAKTAAQKAALELDA